MYHHRRLLQEQNDVVDKQPSNDVSLSLLITVILLAVAVILSASFYLLLRFLRRNTSSTTTSTTRSISSTSAIPRHVSRRVSPLVDSLPLFTSDSLKSTGGGDCAVCLSKFEKKDLLRLLPICCHVFHADCIDTWLNSSQSCPLCRSPVFLPESELLSKLNNNNHHSNDVTSSSPASLSSSSRSFRVEIGNVSRRNNNNSNNSGELPVHRSYSLGGNFDYVVEDDVVSEVHSGSFHRTTFSNEFKLDSDNHYQQHQQQLASEVGTRGGGGGWLKDYLANSLSNSLSSSFRSSGRWFFTGSGRRENTPPMMTSGGDELEMSEMDMEASRLGDEIGELFRWLSGV